MPVFSYKGYDPKGKLVSGVKDADSLRTLKSVLKRDGVLLTEAKEAVIGWAIVEVNSKDEAIELSKRFWQLVGDGSGTIQRVYDPQEVPQQ